MIDKITINGVDVTKYRIKWRVDYEWDKSIDSAEIEFSSKIYDVVKLETGQSIRIERGFSSVNEDVCFIGVITQVSESYAKTKISCKNPIYDAIKSSRIKSWDRNIDIEEGIGSEIFKDICDHSKIKYTPAKEVLTDGSIHFTGDSSDLKIVKFIQNDEDNFEKMNELSELYNYIITYDYQNNIIEFKEKGYLNYPKELTVGTDIPGQIKWKENMEELINKVKVEGATVYDKIVEQFTGPDSEFILTKSPEDTEVRINYSTTNLLQRRGQKDVGVLGVNHDYYVDVEQKKIVFSSDVSDLWINYGAQVPLPVELTNNESIDKYGGPEKVPHQKKVHYNDIKDIDDAIQRGITILNKYSTPFLEAEEVPVLDSVIQENGFIKPGYIIKINDTFNSKVVTAFVRGVIKEWPHVLDKITIGDEIWKTEDWQARQMKDIQKLFAELNKNQDILYQVIINEKDFKAENRFFDLYKRNIESGYMIFGHPYYGIFDENNYSDEIYDGSVVRPFDLLIRMQGEDKYSEYFYDEFFVDYDNSSGFSRIGSGGGVYLTLYESGETNLYYKGIDDESLTLIPITSKPTEKFSPYFNSTTGQLYILNWTDPYVSYAADEFDIYEIVEGVAVHYYRLPESYWTWCAFSNFDMSMNEDTGDIFLQGYYGSSAKMDGETEEWSYELYTGLNDSLNSVSVDKLTGTAYYSGYGGIWEIESEDPFSAGISGPSSFTLIPETSGLYDFWAITCDYQNKYLYVLDANDNIIKRYNINTKELTNFYEDLSGSSINWLSVDNINKTIYALAYGSTANTSTLYTFKNSSNVPEELTITSSQPLGLSADSSSSIVKEGILLEPGGIFQTKTLEYNTSRTKYQFDANYDVNVYSFILGESVIGTDSLSSLTGTDGERLKFEITHNNSDWHEISEFNTEFSFTAASTDIRLRITNVSETSSELLSQLFSYYKLDETTGTTATEEVNDNHATITGTPTWDTGKIENSLELDATAYASMTASTINKYFSIGAWVEIDSSGDEKVIYSERCRWGTTDVGLRNRVLIRVLSDKRIEFRLRTKFGKWNDYDDIWYTTSALTDGWQHVVCIRNNDIVEVYINGISVSFTTSFNAPIGNSTIIEYDLRDSYDDEAYFGYMFPATNSPVKLDEFFIYTKALSESQVSLIYNGGSGLQYPFGKSILLETEMLNGVRIKPAMELRVS